MKVTIKGGAQVTLTQNDFRGAGGQASVYVRKGIAYKIYTDPANALPEAKFQILQAIQDDHVIKPSKVLLNDRLTPIGYTMAEVPSKTTLGHLFTRNFRDRNSITQDNIVTISAKFRERLPHIHAAKALVVDLNAMNLLVPDTWDDVFFIDVDSYQVAGYPATYLNPAVRDYSVRNSHGWSELSDWFSYAVLTYQLFTGGHPYGGNHSLTDGMPPQQHLEYRMQNNISGFRAGARYPKCVQPVTVIPETFRGWLKTVLEDGQRLPPPDPRGGPTVAIVTAPTYSFGRDLLVQEVQDYGDWDILQYVESSGSTLVLLAKAGQWKVRHNNWDVFEGPALQGDFYLGFTSQKNLPVGLHRQHTTLTLFNFQTKTPTLQEIQANDLTKSGDRFYLRSGPRVMEVDFIESTTNVLVSASHCVADVLEQASDLYEGVAIQNMLGSVYVSVFPKAKHGYQVRIPELDKLRVLDAKFEGGVLMVIAATASGTYDRLIFRFDEGYQTYDLRRIPDVPLTGLNFITLPSGICLVLTEEEKLEAFSSSKGAKAIKIVQDLALGSDMRLMRAQGRASFHRKGRIYTISLK